MDASAEQRKLIQGISEAANLIATVNRRGMGSSFISSKYIIDEIIFGGRKGKRIQKIKNILNGLSN